ncbi:DUF7210 family protein [Pseudomonas gingeri]|uniref:DUF7210 family protein n=1 Tax=Pseudomonas gingeri TaxID=117681 RepID=UPI0015BB3C5F|nr:hypothetical protein [Pseudomonas gingeri]NWD49022.1 hypothetical protein [Pseudomonas gingeri]
MKKGADAASAGGLPAASDLAADQVPAGTTVTLLKPHTHARVDYPAGAEIKLTAEQITWLQRLGVVAGGNLEK